MKRDGTNKKQILNKKMHKKYCRKSVYAYVSSRVKKGYEIQDGRDNFI